MEDIFTTELPALPDSLASKFEMISCKKHSEECCVYLLKEKQSRRLALLKASDDPFIAQTLQNEKQILDIIHASGHSHSQAAFPRALLLETHGNTTYYIRTYISGKRWKICAKAIRKNRGWRRIRCWIIRSIWQNFCIFCTL